MPVLSIFADSSPRAMVSQAKAALSGSGILIVRDAIERQVLDDAGEAVTESFCRLDASGAKRLGVCVGDRRYMVSVDLSPPFDRPEIFASPPLLAIARATLGIDVIINSLTVVISLPGAEAQRPHVDHLMLFPSDETASMALPPYALTAIVPLLDLTVSTGSTEVWPRGQQMANPDLWQGRPSGSTVLPLGLGDVGMIDYRVCHGGTANLSRAPRPILYIVYSRPWFRDAENFSEIPPLRISAEQLARVPREHKGLFAAAAAGHLA